ncbi:MAG: RNA polymerase sigma factor [Clostridia bacterium]|nr:RNA polymerase sigma factor [Clostridia bacterium]
MTHDEIIQYYDYLMRLATSKSNSPSDAEDLVGDTMLAAFAYLHKGGTIEYPKTWLTNTLYHKHNDNLRKKYRAPVTVCLDEGVDIAETEDEEYFMSEEASKVRKELNYLSFITREVLIRFYFGNQSVSDIAEGLGIPEGTVKSRLSAGRTQMKKGLETMEIRENYLPGELYLSFGGSEGLKNEPMSLVEGDLIAQNLLILAYEKPITVSELSKAIGIPTAYIEPIVKKLVDGELMVQMNSGKVYTDFIITKPQNSLETFKPQLDFAHKHFDTIWSILRKMSDVISKMTFQYVIENEERTKLDRYAILKALQDFQHFGTGKIETPKFPKRRDGGCWFAQATAFDAGYNMKEYNEASEYAIHGGHRTTEAFAAGGTRRIRLYEFDTTLWDNPHRYGFSYELYFKHIIPFLWCIFADIPLDERVGYDIPHEIISYIPTLETIGLIKNTQNKLCVKIPVLKKGEYEELCAVIKTATEEIKSAVGEEFTSFISSMKTPIPKHLTSVPELFRYHEATKYFVMSIVREAYEKGMHLKDVDYCCPPVVMVYACVE